MNPANKSKNSTSTGKVVVLVDAGSLDYRCRNVVNLVRSALHNRRDNLFRFIRVHVVYPPVPTSPKVAIPISSPTKTPVLIKTYTRRNKSPSHDSFSFSGICLCQGSFCVDRSA